MALDLGNPPPGLPALDKPPCRHMKGPTSWSNWVIKNHVIAGAYPASLDDRETDVILTKLLELGINTFVCLQAEVSLNITEAGWRGGQGLRPYIKDAQKILTREHEMGSTRITQPKLDFLHLPIVDGSVTSDEAMIRLRDDCCDRILRGEKLYIHCWGGHGRTGTLVCLILGKLYGIRSSTALYLCQAYHDTRKYPQNVRSPQTSVQRVQVQRILGQREPRHQSAPNAGLYGSVLPARGAPKTMSVGRSSRNKFESPAATRARLRALEQTTERTQGLSLSGASAAQRREPGYSTTSRRMRQGVQEVPERSLAPMRRDDGYTYSSSRKTLIL
mmetsp:Transcript_29971/g.84557  ORF Transcript_29971/g.84557 Transcript_29971/m.84557 type:complete len:331 (-) Transcript_29971:175-1167(-)|eukprot:CAMPEP_0117651732 /NCGR_PEP_ID=MMETSP0804-20121206/2251_1 /TAXON_ID=1074897 /ORGANISM="Tetraselmis astigmatica, Strain CCMP880" /LENGTH=330 /DNA_ID=CAMNT_0005457733 /DNA_START=752 /DNA_END=1744 /DNA_ORIENTATION=+